MSFPGYKTKSYEVLGHTRSRCCPACWKRRSLCCKITMAISTVCVAAILATVIALAVSMPFHASCKIDWVIPQDCTTVRTTVRDQMIKWQGRDFCPNNNGEKCLYTVKSMTDTQLKGTHSTPVKGYVDDLTFTFSGSGSTCNVHGYSTSETWYAVLDYSTNYCNLHNLMVGSNLTTMAGFRESTSDSICTQYSSANCDKY